MNSIAGPRQVQGRLCRSNQPIASFAFLCGINQWSHLRREGIHRFRPEYLDYYERAILRFSVPVIPSDLVFFLQNIGNSKCIELTGDGM